MEGKFEGNQNAGQRFKNWPKSDVKFEQISLILTTYKNIDILFLIEIFLKSTSKPDSVYNIPDYCLFWKDRGGPKNGVGLIAYVSEKVKVNIGTVISKTILSSRYG